MNESKKFKELQHELMAMKSRLVKQLGEKKYTDMLMQYERFRRTGDYMYMPRHPAFVLAQVVEQMVMDSRHWNNYLEELEERNKLMDKN